MPFSVDIPQLPALVAALEAWPDIAQPILEETSSAALLSLIPDLATYPPAPAGSRYRRTGTLGRTWTSARPEFAPLSSGFEARIGNAAPYAEDVQGERQLALFRRIGWPNVGDVVTQRQADVEGYFDTALQQIAEAVDAKAGA